MIGASLALLTMHLDLIGNVYAQNQLPLHLFQVAPTTHMTSCSHLH